MVKFTSPILHSSLDFGSTQQKKKIMRKVVSHFYLITHTANT